MNVPDIVLLVAATGLFVGLGMWAAHLRVRHRIEQQAASRTRQMSELIERAQCVLWESEVLLETDDWEWRLRLHPSEFCRQLFRGRIPDARGDLWAGFEVEGRREMDVRAREAITGGEPGYEQEFRAVREGRTYWLHENVSITKLGTDRYWLVGLVTDITAQREAEAARRQSELTVERILAHAQCMIWRATVILDHGVLRWPHFDMPHSRLSEQLFSLPRVFAPERGFWDSLSMPEQAEMNDRSTRAILSGAAGYDQQFRAVTTTGRTFWLNERVSITRVSEGVWSLVGVVTDVTAQVEAQQESRQNQERLRKLLDTADCMVWEATVVLRPDDSLDWDQYIPPSALYRRIFGEPGPEGPRLRWGEINVPEYDEMVARTLAAMKSRAPGYTQEFQVVQPQGGLWLRENVTMSELGAGRFRMTGVITDITAQHTAELARQQSEMRLSTLLEQADCMIWQGECHRRGPEEFNWRIFTPRSQLYRRLFGHDPEGDCQFAWSEAVPEFAEMRARARRALTTGQTGYEQVFHFRHPDGDVWLNEKVTIRPVGTDRWEMIGLITDITARRRSEEARLASEQRLGELLSRADCLLWESTVVLKPDGWQWDRSIQPSLLYQRLTGSPLPKPTVEMWPKDRVPERSEMDRRCRDALLGGRPAYDQVFQFVKDDGESAWISENVTIHRLDDERYWLVGVALDVTAQRKAEEAQRQIESRLEEILTRADCLLWEATAELEPAGWRWHFNIQPSLLCQKLFGQSRPSPDCGLWRTFDIPERPEMDRRCRQAMVEGWAGYEQVFHIVRRDAPAVWISENVSVRPLGRNRYSLVGVAVDITAVRRAEEALASEKERLAVTLRAMNEAVITCDTAGRVQFVNPAAAALLERGAADCIGRPVEELCRLESARTGQPVRIPVERVARGDVRADLPVQTRLLGANGRQRLVEGCCAPIHAADSKVTGTVLVLRDVTEQDRLEQELVRATRLESVGVLAGGIAHDFNNILTAVMGNLTLAQLDLPAESPAGTSVRSAEKAALRARDLTQQLLTFAKGGEPVRAAVQLEAVVREMTGFALSGSQVKAHFDLAPDLWPADADKGQIGRVVQNLVINAVQAMPRGGTLRIVARNDVQDGFSQPGLVAGHYIQIAITDSGEGIRPDHLSRIFDPYFTTKQSGTGLGLAAVYSIIKKHHGHIDVESQLGQGTTFRLWLPASRTELAPAETARPWGEEPRLRGSVLFMDDEEIIRTMAVMLLRRFGLAVDCAADGAEAVAKYQAALQGGRRYDIVIMDLTVPGGMGGLAALGQLRLIDPAVKAVVSSGYSSDPVLANHREHGFAAVVAKPYEVGEIARVLQELLPSSQ